MVRHLIMSPNGTRDAAANLQEEVRSFMNKNKADQSKYSPSVCHNKECGLISLVHGDDFITVSQECQVVQEQARGQIRDQNKDHRTR